MERFLHGLLKDLEQRCANLRDRLANLSAHEDVLAHILVTYQVIERVRREASQLLADPSLGTRELVPNHLQLYRRWNELAILVESYPLPFVERYSASDRRLTGLVRRLAEQVGWTLSNVLPPLVGSFSAHYFWTKPEFVLIGAPALAGENLLVLPDLCHEIGHILLLHHEATLIGDFPNELERYIEEERRRVKTHQRPPNYEHLYDLLFVEWRDQWQWEFASDVVATYMVGPAFGWQHVRLCAGGGRAAYRPVLGEVDEHPADEARLRAVLCVLQQAGHAEVADRIQSLWQSFLAASGETKPADYDVCYPQPLIQSLAHRVTEGCRALGLRGYGLPSDAKDPASLPALMNEAWERFLADPHAYGEWERTQLSQLWQNIGPSVD